MPFIPHTQDDIAEMLQAIGAKRIDDLFDEIPVDLRSRALNEIPKGLTEMEVARLMKKRAAQDRTELNFIGAGSYEHHIPAAVWDIVSRGEFMTAYTPYQAEASQGTLQLLYEYQTMMASLMGMDVSNASLYDGASALAEAVLMAVRANRRSQSKRILVAGTLHPHYRRVVEAIVHHQKIELIDLAYDAAAGHIPMASLRAHEGTDFAAIIMQQPNFFGVLEEVDAITDWAHQQNALVIASVNPIAMALIKEPGKWGQKGADIACGEGQPLGVPMASGGPYFGFICCKQEFVRQMPGRIIGRTVDKQGKVGFALTLQAREQHIRRSKATSNICTNQGLLVTAATIYMSLLGFSGLQKVAMSCYRNTQSLVKKLTAISGVELVFNRAVFHECVIRLPRSSVDVLNEIAELGIQGGFAINSLYPELTNCILVCVTETKTEEELDHYAKQLACVLSGESKKKVYIKPELAAEAI